MSNPAKEQPQGAPDFQGCPLRSSWVVYNRYKRQEKRVVDSKNYHIDLEQLTTLSNLDEFMQFWKYTSYNDLSTIFNPQRPCFLKSNSAQERPKQVDAIFVFKKDVKPEWEDPLHRKGGYFQADLKLSEQQLDDFWENLFIWIICGDYEHYELITGFRLIDNLKLHGCIRFEVWFTCGYECYRRNGPEQ